MSKLTIAQLNSKYDISESVDKSIFAEERSNILLVTGNHYNKRKPDYLSRLRNSKHISQQSKLRLTKNHIATITKTYINNIVNASPNVAVIPNNSKEANDMKAAELHNSVWSYIKHAHNFKDKVYQYVSDFIEIGEVAVKISWDGNKGSPIPIEEKRNEFTGEIEELIQLMSGDLVFERIYGFDLLRDPAANEMSNARWMIHRKMVDKKELEYKYRNEPDKLKFITESGKETYVVFQGQSGRYDHEKGKILIREFYFRPTPLEPQGYYYHTTENGILEEGELPKGIFPIIYTGFDRIPTSPRHQSLIKQLRPYQAEINRTASKIAEHQTSVGDDKVFIQAGTKLAPSAAYSGIRGYQYTGQIPTVLAGRSGAQYLDYMNSQIQEMYQVAKVQEDMQKGNAQLDPYGMLFRSMKDKKNYSMYAEKIERFLEEICITSLKLIKHHAPEQAIYPMIGRDEIVNMHVFKKMDDLRYQIRVEPRSDDFETMVGRQLSFQHVLQYASGQMQPEQIGQVIRNMPLANAEDITDDLTIDYDNAQNDILALDSGRPAPAQQNDNHKYMIKRLDHRMRKSDFDILPDEVKRAYFEKRQQHIEFDKLQMQQIQQAKAGFIPSGGYLVGCDFYVNYDPQNPEKTRRARVPFEAISWLIGKLDQQGMNQDAMAGMEQSTQADMYKAASMQGGQEGSPMQQPQQQMQ